MEAKKDDRVLISDITGRLDDDKRLPPNPPDLEGFLYKLKHKSRPLLGAWNKRWFQIDAERRALVYFRNKSDAARYTDRPDGVIMLEDIMNIESFDNLSFQLETRSRTFHLKADTKIEKSCWTSALEGFLSQKKEYDRWQSVHAAVISTINNPEKFQEGKLESKGWGSCKSSQDCSSDEDDDSEYK